MTRMRDPQFIADYKSSSGDNSGYGGYGGLGGNQNQNCAPMMRNRLPTPLKKKSFFKGASKKKGQKSSMAPPPPQVISPPPPPPYAPQQQQQQQQQQPPPYVQQEQQEASPVKEPVQKETNLNASYTVNTFGFGANHNEQLLKGIAEVGNGLYFYIENKEVLGDAFIDCIGGLLSVVGQDLSLSLSPAPGVELLEVLTSYPKQRDGSKTTLKIKDIQSEERRDIVCRVKLPVLASPATESPALLTATLEYNNVLTSQRARADTTLCLARPAPESKECKEATPNLFVSEQYNRMAAVAALKQAADLADKNDLTRANECLQAAIENVENSPAADNSYCKDLLKSMAATKAQMKDRGSYRRIGGKSARASCLGYEQQRSNLQTPQFANQKKSAMSAAFKSFKKRAK